MKEELKKSLTDLIDETLLELEELKKSRFSAAEMDIKGPGADSLAGQPVNGKIAAKAEDDEPEDEPEDDEDEDEDDEDDDEDADVEKADDVNELAEKAEGTNEKVDKAEDAKHEAKEKKLAKELLNMHKSLEEVTSLKKSVDEMESLFKSYVDEKVGPLEAQLATILEAVTKLANTPVPASGMSYKGVVPLMKSNETHEPLSKSEVASKLFELKKSGTRVDSADVARAEMGHDLEQIVAKYNIQ